MVAIHDLPLITTVAVSLSCAFIFGLIAIKLRLPSIVGYMVAGMIVGPHTPGFVADMKLAEELAEIGVIFLMFGVGLHFSFKDLLKVKEIAIPGAIVQILVATLLGIMVTHMWGWSLIAGFVLGLSLSVASTVVLLRALETQDALHSLPGKIAIGWLIVEDLVMILILVLLPAFAETLTAENHGLSSKELFILLSTTIGKICLFIACMLALGDRILPWLLTLGARTGSREIFTIAVFSVAMGIAFGATYLFGVSLALGAFFAGMMLKESDWCHRVAENALPFQDAFAVLFFVSVGMLFNINIIFSNPWHLLAVVLIILLGKSIAAFFIITLFRYPLDIALMVSISLVQIGEFSFILANLGRTYNILPPEGHSLILAGALITIALNPLFFSTIKPLTRFLSRYPTITRLFRVHRERSFALNERENLKNTIIIVGYGRVGRYLCDSLTETDLHLVVIDQNHERIQIIRERGLHAITGDASQQEVLFKASIEKAKAILIAVPNSFDAKEITRIAMTLNPSIQILVRTKDEEEMSYFKEHQVALVLIGEQEIASCMSKYVIEKFGA